MMKAVRLSRLHKSFCSFVDVQLRSDSSGAIRCYSAAAVLERENGSDNEASIFRANGEMVNGGHTRSRSKTPHGHSASDDGYFRENGAETVQRKSKLSKSEEGPKVFQQLDPQSEGLTTAQVCRVLNDQTDPALAWKLFVWAGKQQGFKHSIETCNQMILTFCNTRNFNAVPDLLKFMHQAGLPLPKVGCSRIIQGLARRGQHRKAVLTFREIMASGYRANTVLYNQYLNALVKTGDYDQIEAALAEMQRDGHVPNVYTYTILINGFGKAKNMQKAWDTYTEMKARSCPPNEVTCISMMSILKAAGETEKGLQVINETFKSRDRARNFLKYLSSSNSANAKGLCLAPDGAAYSPKSGVDRTGSCDETLLTLLCSTEDLDSAMRALLDMLSQVGRRPSTQICNFVLYSMGKEGQVDAVLELMRRLRAEGVVDHLSYEATIGALCEASRMEEALQLTSEMQEQGLAVSTGICNKLILHLNSLGQSNRVFELLLQLQNVEPDVATYIALMSALCKTNELSRALQCLNEAGVTTEFPSTRVEGGLTLIKKIRNPRWSIYVLLLSNLCRNQRPDDAVDLLVYMQENGPFLWLHKNVEPRVYGRVLRLLGSQCQVEKAWWLFQRLKSGSNPEPQTCAVTVHILGKAGWFSQAYQVMEEMRNKGSPPDVYTYNSLLNSLRKRGKLDDMHRVLGHMERDGCVPSTVTYSVLSNAFAGAGQVDKAYYIFEEGIERGCIPGVSSYNALLRGYVQGERVHEAVDLYNVMVEMGCRPNDATYSILSKGLSHAGLSDIVSQVLAERKGEGLALRPLELQKVSR